jgi:hypothetical protein
MFAVIIDGVYKEEYVVNLELCTLEYGDIIASEHVSEREAYDSLYGEGAYDYDNERWNSESY